MKLIKRTYLYTLKWLLPVVIIGSVFCFYTIEYVAHEETDEFLTYEMERIISYHDENQELPEFNKVSEIIPDLAYATPVFKDTMMLETGDNEMVPYRELRFSIKHKSKDFTMVLRHLMLGTDDIIEGTLLIVIGIMVIVAIFMALILNRLTKKIWTPFYESLGKLTTFKIAKPLPDFPETSIDEFTQLNKTLDRILNKISKDYYRNKEFNENISHELQTQLAVIRSSTEKIINEVDEQSKGKEELKQIYAASTKLTQIQKSLLLLSRLTNEEYVNKLTVSLNKSLVNTIDFFSDTIELRELKLTTEIATCSLEMYDGLAEVLFENLIKNAIKHNIDNGFIAISLSDKSFKIENSGLPFHGDPSELVNRFSIGKKGNWGIGLSIVQQICDLHQFKLNYTISEAGIHCIVVEF